MTIPANDETKQAFKIYLLKELASVDFNQILSKIKAQIESGDIATARSTFSEAAKSLLSFGNALDFGQRHVFRQPSADKYKAEGTALESSYGEDDESPSGEDGGYEKVASNQIKSAFAHYNNR